MVYVHMKEILSSVWVCHISKPLMEFLELAIERCTSSQWEWVNGSVKPFTKYQGAQRLDKSGRYLEKKKKRVSMNLTYQVGTHAICESQWPEMTKILPEHSSVKHIRNPCLCCPWGETVWHWTVFPEKSKQLLRVGPASRGSLGVCAGFWLEVGYLQQHSREPKPLILINSSASGLLPPSPHQPPSPPLLSLS